MLNLGEIRIIESAPVVKKQVSFSLKPNQLNEPDFERLKQNFKPFDFKQKTKVENISTSISDKFNEALKRIGLLKTQETNIKIAEEAIKSKEPFFNPDKEPEAMDIDYRRTESQIQEEEEKINNSNINLVPKLKKKSILKNEPVKRTTLIKNRKGNIQPLDRGGAEGTWEDYDPPDSFVITGNKSSKWYTGE